MAAFRSTSPTSPLRFFKCLVCSNQSLFSATTTLESLQNTWWRLSVEAFPPPPEPFFLLGGQDLMPLARPLAQLPQLTRCRRAEGKGQKITHENQKQKPIGTTNGNGLGKKGPGMLGLLIKLCVPLPFSPREEARPAHGQACSFWGRPLFTRLNVPQTLFTSQALSKACGSVCTRAHTHSLTHTNATLYPSSLLGITLSLTPCWS